LIVIEAHVANFAISPSFRSAAIQRQSCKAFIGLSNRAPCKNDWYRPWWRWM